MFRIKMGHGVDRQNVRLKCMPLKTKKKNRKKKNRQKQKKQIREGGEKARQTERKKDLIFEYPMLSSSLTSQCVYFDDDDDDEMAT